VSENGIHTETAHSDWEKSASSSWFVAGWEIKQWHFKWGISEYHRNYMADFSASYV
jgi:hypothetical protein